ncbi:hypothetical protein BLS_006729 [Venturia inaequalis]|uniref:Uncharacterized protein n=1 Tax=Venturia inaequalis TaxID=5025 RepID=A0A8H3VLY3_VENIN|nr:hypothetical protein BLS_006729 [Venturia inaequalis]KAE9986688.1 hypothetical protein EG328_005015 [Venturia inaequalis]KAE9989358.1 hypothetical protein EG327_002835 [Venturia inaequalis]
MNTVRSASIAVPGQCNHIQGVSAIEAQRKTARILAVTEVSEYDYKLDISSVSGGAPTRNNTSETFVNREGGPKKSYYFPVDPEQPAWRPIVMRRPWITLLVFIALALSGLQEFLCRLSMRRAKGTPPKGILTFERAAKLTLWQYFAWKYMPTVVLLSYGIMWQAVDYEVKRLEPYYQLSKRVGATARDSLNQDYLTFTAYLVPFKAVRAKQWAVVYSSMATLFAGSLVPVLQSASICMLPDKKDRQVGHDKYVRMDPIWSRVLSGALLCVALFGVLLLNQLRRKSGLLSDPKGIAGIASMATKSHILNDFEGLDVAPNNVIHNQLRTRRYNLHKSSLWQGQYIKSEEKVQNVKEEHPHPCLLRLQAGIPFVTYILLVGASIPCFVFIEDAKFVSERVPFLLTALATGIKLGWGELDMNLRVIEPYYVLSRRNAPPRTLVMDYTGTVPGYYSLLAWRDGHYLLASVGFGSILTEILTVCVTSFSVDGRRFIAGNGGDDKSDGETFRSFWVSFALAMGIILYLVIMAYLVYKLRRHRFLPRQPGTIAGVLAFIHQSNMLDDFNDTERMDSRQMRQHLEKLGKTYALGWFNGRDGEDHCGVDQEPLVAPYKFGVDWKKGRVNNFGQDWSTY